MGWLDKTKEWMTPERAAAFQGIGMGLSQLGAGQAVDMSPAYAALEQRKQQTAMRKMMEVPGVMDKFTPEQQAVLASMPEGLATQIIMEHAFKAQEPVAGVNVGGNLVNPYTGEVMYSAPGEAPAPIEVGGVLLDPVTMQPIFDSRATDTPDVPAAFAALDMQAQAAGFEPGSPGYQEFMMNGGGSGAPAAFIALDMQAKAAGFEPGTPGYQEFMATRGAGLAAAATEKGKAAAEAEIAAPGDVATADQTLAYIDSLRSHPGREAATGMDSFRSAVPGTDARDFAIENKRLASGAFLTAINELRGMGALSNSEGQTATAAIAALETEGTEGGYLKRLAEYEEIVKLGRERAARRVTADGSPMGGASGAGDFGLSEEDLKYLEAP